MRKLSQDVVNIMNVVGNARYRADELRHAINKNFDIRDIAKVLSDLEDKLYSVIGITYDDFAIKYRTLANYDLELDD